MKKFYTVFFVLCLLNSVFAQSPFSYGQNKDVYFISKALQNKLGLQTIYSVGQRHDNDAGGMGENWDVTLITFEANTISQDWYPITLDSTFKYNFDSLTNGMEVLNGTQYQFSNEKLT